MRLFDVTCTGFAAAIFNGSAAMLMVRADPLVTHTERFERQVLPCLDQVYSAALCLTGDPAEAENLVVDAYARAYEAFLQDQPRTGRKVWLYRILVAARRGQRPAGGSVAASATGDQPPVRRALRDLPEDLRFAIYLADVDGFSCHEIAEITGTSTGTVTTRLRDARRSLRRRLSTSTERRP